MRGKRIIDKTYFIYGELTEGGVCGVKVALKTYPLIETAALFENKLGY